MKRASMKLLRLRKTPELTDSEKLFLKALRTLAKRQQPATYRAIADEAGWKSVNMAWEMRTSLITKGLIVMGKRLALVECPVEVSKAA